MRLKLIGVLGLLALGACMPPTSMPTPAPLTEDASSEVGLVLSGMLSADEELATTPESDSIVALGLTTRHRVGDRWTLGGQALLGSYELEAPWFALGGELRFTAWQNQRFTVGTSLGAGWLYARLGVPASMRLGEHLWLGTHPGVYRTYFL